MLIAAYSDSFQELLGDRHPIYGSRVRDLWPDLWLFVEPQFQHVLQGGAGARQDYTVRDANGRELLYEIAYSALHDADGSVVGVFVTLFDRTQALAEQRHTAALVRLMSATNHSRDLDALVDLLLDVLQGALRADALALYLREGDLVRLMGYRGDQMYASDRLHTMPISDDRMPARAIREARTLVLEDTEAQLEIAGASAPILLASRLRSGMVVPLRGRRGILGALAYSRHMPYSYGREEIRRLEELVSHGAAALENALLFHESSAALARLRGLFNHAPVGIAIYDDSDAFNCQEHNPAFLSLVGDEFIRRGSIVGVPLRDLFDEESFGAVQAIFQRVRATGEVFTIDEFPAVLLPDPVPRYYTWSLTPLPDERGGMSLLLSAVEITAQVRSRRRIEELAGHAEARAGEFEAVIAAMADGVMVTDAAGTVILVNEAGQRIGGPVPREVGTLADLAAWRNARDPFTQRPLAREEMPGMRALNGETVVNFTYLIRPPGAVTDMWLSTSATPLRARSGAIRGAVMTLHDITREKELEREKDDFLSVASHELKTPLTSVKGMLQVAQKRLERGEQTTATAALREAESQSNRLQKLVDDLLDLGRIQSGRLTLNCERLDLNVLVRGAVSRIRRTTHKHRIHLETIDQPLWIDADPSRIDQVLDNVLGNATKYSPNGGEIDVRVEHADAAVIYIRDRGIGIPPNGRGQLFDRFYRAGNASVRHFSGLGVGLWLCRQIMDSHHGRIWLESSGAEGSTFGLSLPLAADQPFLAQDGDRS